MLDFKKISESSTSVTYAYKTDYEELSIRFDLEMKCVDFSYMHFVFKEPTLEPQREKETDKWLKHSCKYGHWQSDIIVCLSAEDIEFVNNKCKELFV